MREVSSCCFSLLNDNISWVIEHKQNKTKPLKVPETGTYFVNGDFEPFLWREGCVDGGTSACPFQRPSLWLPQRCFRVIRVGIGEAVVFSLTCVSKRKNNSCLENAVWGSFLYFPWRPWNGGTWTEQTDSLEELGTNPHTNLERFHGKIEAWEAL